MTSKQSRAGGVVRADGSGRRGYLALLLLCLLVWGRTVGFELTTWDDDVNVSRNPLLNAPLLRNVVTLWSAPYSGLFVPVTYTWLAIESAVSRGLFGADGEPNPRVFHLGNVLLHVACTLLVYRALRRWVGDGAPAWLGAALFGVHPVQAESVAWVSETKGLLATLFSLTAIELRAAAETGVSVSAARGGRLLRSAGAMGCYVLAILSKPAAMALPLVVFAADVGLRRRPARRTALGLMPWLAIAAAAAVVTKSQQPDRLAGDVVPLLVRPLVALDALAFYLGKVIWPARLGIDYGRTPTRVLADGTLVWSWLVPAAVVAALVVRRDRRLAAAAAIFAAWLLPVLGLVPFAQQYTSTVADRYLYAAMLGVALAVATVLARRGPRLHMAAAAIVAVLAATSFAHSSRWKTSETLYRQALQVNPTSAAAHGNLGSLLLADGRIEESMSHFDAALAASPRHVPALLGRGDALLQSGHSGEAVAQLEKALALAPDFVPTRLRLADALASAGREEQAARQLEAAHALRPDDPDVNGSLGAYYLSRGDLARAEPLLRRAVAVDPRFADAHNHLATCLWNLGDEEGALDHYRAAFRADPRCFEAYRDAGKLLFNRGDRTAAEALWRRAAEIRPDDEEVRSYLAEIAGG